MNNGKCTLHLQMLSKRKTKKRRSFLKYEFLLGFFVIVLMMSFIWEDIDGIKCESYSNLEEWKIPNQSD